MTALAIPSQTAFALGSLTGELEALSTRLRRFTVRIRTQDSRVGGVGAGIVWGTTAGALVVTNAHVVPAQSSELVVQSSSGVEEKARVIACDRERDHSALML